MNDDTASDDDAADSGPAEGTGRRRVVLRRCAWAAAVAVMLVGPLAARVAWEGRAELEDAASADRAGDVELQIEHLGRAARWRMPGWSHDEEALRRLEDIATAAEIEGEPGTERALSAYREVRRALLATRAWGVSDRGQLTRVNERIASLMAQQERRFGTDVGRTGDPYAHHLALLEESPGPTPWVAHLAALAFVGWLVTTAGFVLRSLDARGRLIGKPAVRWGLSSVLLLVAWVVALRFAS